MPSSLVDDIRHLIISCRTQVVTAVTVAMRSTYWAIGRRKERAGVSRILLSAPVSIDGEINYGIVSLQYDSQMKRMVFHDVYTVERTMMESNKAAQQELLKQGASFREEGQRSRGGEETIEPTINILRRYLFVNAGNVSKLVDENGEPISSMVCLQKKKVGLKTYCPTGLPSVRKASDPRLTIQPSPYSISFVATCLSIREILALRQNRYKEKAPFSG